MKTSVVPSHPQAEDLELRTQGSFLGVVVLLPPLTSLGAKTHSQCDSSALFAHSSLAG